MKLYKVGLAGMALFGAMACTSLSEGEGTLPPDPAHNQRVRYSEGGNEEVRRQMYENASHTNRKRNIEEPNPNGPATAPPTLRPIRIPNAPVDSTRHNVQRPVQHRVPVN